MPAIRPVSDLRNNYPEIEKLLQDQPVFLTKNGVGSSVIMSMAEYDKLQRKIDLYAKLAEADADIASGDTGRDIDEVFAELRAKYRD